MDNALDLNKPVVDQFSNFDSMHPQLQKSIIGIDLQLDNARTFLGIVPIIHEMIERNPRK